MFKVVPSLYFVFIGFFLVACSSKVSRMTYKGERVKVTVTSPESVKAPAVVSIDEKGAVTMTAPLSYSPEEVSAASYTNENAKAKAKAFLWYHGTAIAFFVVALFLLWKGHLTAGLCAIVGAPSVLVLGHFGQSERALLLCMVLSGLVIAFFGAWYLLKWRGMIKE